MNHENHETSRMPPDKGPVKTKQIRIPEKEKVRQTTFDMLHELSMRGVLFESANSNVKDPITPLDEAKAAYVQKFSSKIPYPVDKLSYHVNQVYVYLYGFGLLFIWNHQDKVELTKGAISYSTLRKLSDDQG